LWASDFIARNLALPVGRVQIFVSALCQLAPRLHFCPESSGLPRSASARTVAALGRALAAIWASESPCNAAAADAQSANRMSEPAKSGGELFIVDNIDESWKGLKYLQDWTEVASSFDIAAGYFEIGPEVEKVSWSKNTVWLQKAQTVGFKGVREDVWNFHIGGYQVCEKWLKDRKGRNLTADNRTHYQNIMIAVSKTIRLMAEIDAVIEKHGAWPLK
jgi:hypothetical protein